MKVFTPNKIRFLVLISILLLIFSIIPSWTALQIGSFIPTEHAKMTFMVDHDSDVEIWSEIVGLDNEPVFDQEAYYNTNIERLGPEAILKRSQNSKTYIGPDNLVTMQIYSGDIHYLSSLGAWEEFNNELKEYYLKPPSMDIKYDYACEANTIRSYFRSDYSMPNTMTVGMGDDFVTWEPKGMKYIDNTGTEVEVSKPMQANAIVKNNKILYPGSYQNAADLFTVMEHKVKHEIIIDKLPVVATKVVNYEPITLSLNGNLIPSDELRLYIKGESKPINRELTTGQALEWYAKESFNRIYLPAPIAYEFYNKAVSIPCEYSVEPIGDIFKLSINTPYYWLADPARKFPVVIDPTMAGQQVFNIQPGEFSSNDTWIGNNTVAMETQNFGKDEHLYIGGIGLNYRTLLQFDLSSLPPSDINFQSAFLKLTQEERGDLNYDTEDREVSIHKVEETWKEGTGILNIPTNDGATWNSNGYGDWTGGAGGYFVASEVNKSIVRGTDLAIFSIDNLVKQWRLNPAQNHGLLVKYFAPGSAGSRYKVFCSSNDDYPKWPKLEVIFANDPPIKSPVTTYVWDEDTTESTVILLDEIFTDPNWDDLTITLWDGDVWGDSFQCSVFNATLQGGTANEPWICPIDLKPNMYGSQLITFNATDRIAYTEAPITIQINAINDPPILHPIGPQMATEEEYLYVPLRVTEVEGQKIEKWDINVSHFEDPDTYMDNIFIERDANDKYKAQLIYYPKNSDVPEVNINISVWDGSHHPPLKQSIDWEHVKITVENVNDAPIFTKIDGSPVLEDTVLITVQQGSNKVMYVQAYDDDIINGDNLEFSSDANEDDGDNFTIEELTGLDVPSEYRNQINTEVIKIDWTPQNKHVGEYIINLKVEDNSDESDTIKLKFNVKNSNDPPQIIAISISPPADGKQYTNQETINFSVEAYDPDQDLQDSNEELNITWYSNVSKLLGYGPKIENVRLKAGIHQIQVSVKDKSDVEVIRTKLLTVEKAITLQKDCEQYYSDNSDFDDVEYSYNDKTKKFSISQGRYEEIDLVNLTGSYENGNLIIELIFATEIELTNDYVIKIFLVTDTHEEPLQDYKATYTSNFLQKGLYQPSDDITYGYFSKTDGKINGNVFRVEDSLADLEIGNDRFKPLKSNFKIFATVKWQEIEYYEKYKVENYRYDSLGWGSAFAPEPVPPPSDDDSGELDASMLLIAGIVVVIVVILILLFILVRKKKEKKTVLDFSKATTTPGAHARPADVQQMFMSPFEQQFRQPQVQQMPIQQTPTIPGQTPQQQPAQTQQLSPTGFGLGTRYEQLPPKKTQ